jgi:hypothetical protein
MPLVFGNISLAQGRSISMGQILVYFLELAISKPIAWSFLF